MTDLNTTFDQLMRAMHHASESGMRVNVSIDISPDRDLRPMATAYVDGAAVDNLATAGAAPASDAGERFEHALATGTIAKFSNGEEVYVKVGASRIKGVVTGIAHYLNSAEWRYQVEWVDDTNRPVEGWYSEGYIQGEKIEN